MLKQRLCGIALLLICVFIVWMCSTGETPEDKDVTAVLLFAPIGFALLFSKDEDYKTQDNKNSKKELNL